MRFRFILQPLMAAIAAIHDGREDARAGRSPYFWTVLRNPRERVGRLREGLNATARIILLGLVMDVIYQLIVLKTFYPDRGARRRVAARICPVPDHPRTRFARRAVAHPRTAR